MVATRKRARPAGSCSLDESTLASLNTSRAPLELTGGHAQPARMVQYFREAKLTDVTIIVDGKSYAAHRNVLAAASDYLDKLFAGPKWADQEQPVKLSQVPGAHTFANILEYIYTGSCMTNESDLISMLEAAHYLQIEPLLRSLQELVARRVDTSNCLEAWKVADTYTLEKLSATAMQMALRSFEQVSTSAGFSGMPLPFVRQLVSDDKLIAQEEQRVFEAAERWGGGCWCRAACRTRRRLRLRDQQSSRKAARGAEGIRRSAREEVAAEVGVGGRGEERESVACSTRALAIPVLACCSGGAVHALAMAAVRVWPQRNRTSPLWQHPEGHRPQTTLLSQQKELRCRPPAPCVLHVHARHREVEGAVVEPVLCGGVGGGCVGDRRRVASVARRACSDHEGAPLRRARAEQVHPLPSQCAYGPAKVPLAAVAAAAAPLWRPAHHKARGACAQWHRAGARVC